MRNDDTFTLNIESDEERDREGLLRQHRADETQRNTAGSYGEFRFFDIIHCIRPYLTDDDLLRFNRLSSAFYFNWGADPHQSPWVQPHKITIDQLSLARQSSIYFRIAAHYEQFQEDRIIPLRKLNNPLANLFFYGARSMARVFNDEFVLLVKQLDAEIKQVSSIEAQLLKNRFEIRENDEKPVLKKIDDTAFQRYMRSFMRIDTFDHFEYDHLQLRKYFKHPVRFQWLIRLFSGVSFFVLYILLARHFLAAYQQNKSQFEKTKSDDAAIALNITGLIHFLPCKTALGNLTSIALAGMTFPRWMEVMGWQNVTNATLKTCLTWLGNCTMASSFNATCTSISNEIMVGCQPHDFPPYDNTLDFSALHIICYLGFSFMVYDTFVGAGSILASLFLCLNKCVLPFFMDNDCFSFIFIWLDCYGRNATNRAMASFVSGAIKDGSACDDAEIKRDTTFSYRFLNNLTKKVNEINGKVEAAREDQEDANRGHQCQ